MQAQHFEAVLKKDSKLQRVCIVNIRCIIVRIALKNNEFSGFLPGSRFSQVFAHFIYAVVTIRRRGKNRS